MILREKKALVVGAGFSGSVVARKLANAEYKVDVVDQRGHIGGNCYTERDQRTGIMVHEYGPHIFNTSIPRVWEYVNKFGEWVPFVNRVKAQLVGARRGRGGVYSMPINLHTINQFFSTNFTPAEAKRFLSSVADKSIVSPQNFEEQAISMIGQELYEAFFKGYTEKQWGCDPKLLPASILKRLPVRFDYNDNYYNTKWQAIPKWGYTHVMENMLSHESISLSLNHSWKLSDNDGYDVVVYSGPIDTYFGYTHGRLGYRTVYWEKEYGIGDIQGNAVINYPSSNVQFTRKHEHKHFAPWETHSDSILFTEYSKETSQGDIPYYPKRLTTDLEILKKYQDLISEEKNTKFIGRLGTYRYLNMDQTILEALELSDSIIQSTK